jgi:preprotein translocase subunit SecD
MKRLFVNLWMLLAATTLFVGCADESIEEDDVKPMKLTHYLGADIDDVNIVRSLIFSKDFVQEYADAMLQGQSVEREKLYAGYMSGYSLSGEVVNVSEEHYETFAKFIDREDIKSRLQYGVKLAWKHREKGDKYYTLVALEGVGAECRPIIDGMGVKAKANTDRFGNYVEITYPKHSAQILEEVTWANVGRSFAVLLDDEVYSMPTIAGGITGGKASIVGDFTRYEVERLAIAINKGN